MHAQCATHHHASQGVRRAGRRRFAGGLMVWPGGGGRVALGAKGLKTRHRMADPQVLGLRTLCARNACAVPCSLHPSPSRTSPAPGRTFSVSCSLSSSLLRSMRLPVSSATLRRSCVRVCGGGGICGGGTHVYVCGQWVGVGLGKGSAARGGGP